MRPAVSSVRPAARAAVGALAAVLLVAGPRNASAQCVNTANGVQCFGTDLSPNPGALSPATLTNSTAARTGFQSSLVGVGTETFESLSGSSPFLLTFPGAGTATLGAGAQIRTAAGAGRYPSSGTHYLEAVSSSNNAAAFTINFGSTVAAFGFFGTDIGDFGSQLTLRFTLANALGTVDWTLPYIASNGGGTARDASALFAGFIDTRGFTSVQFLGTDADDFFGFDDMTIGSIQQVQISSVPEPSSLLLVAVGAAALPFARRFRRRRTA